MFLKHNVGSNLWMHFTKHAKALQVALFQLEKLAHCFHKPARRNGSSSDFAVASLTYNRASMGAIWMEYE